MKEIVLLKYGEIVLKGGNRATFESILMKNIRRRLKRFGEFNITKSQSTITVNPKDDTIDMQEVFVVLQKIFGISALSKSTVSPKTMEGILEATHYLDEDLENARTFKVVARRSDKAFPLNSPEICREVGHYLLERHPHLKVDVHNPQIVVVAEVRDVSAFVHAGQISGAGGMPVGSAGRAALLLSGGIDSPVAGYMMAKRGLEIYGIHFASPPYTSERAKEKVLELCRKMAPYTGRVKLDIVNFTEIQDAIVANCPEEYFTIIMRRFMMEISSIMASSQDCGAIITGESLGQVASQTMHAITCTDITSSLLVLRPVIGMDKEEIVNIARKIDTFETSVLPYEDCCTVFTPRHPKTRPQLQFVIEAEEKLDRNALIEKAIASVEHIIVTEA